jgi:hypothetical protein
MYRYEIAIDDAPHLFVLDGPPLAVAANGWYAEFWAEHTGQPADPVTRAFQVFGTGHALPEGAKWAGTCPRSPDGLVWHLYEVARG